RSCHLLPPLDDERLGALVLARLVALGGLAPRGHGVASARGLAFPAAVRMVHGVHGHPAVGGPAAQPAGPPRLAARDVLVVDVADLSYRGLAVHGHHADLA